MHQPNAVKVIDTSAFINTKIDYGLDFVFHLMDSVTLTIISLVNFFYIRVWRRESGGPMIMLSDMTGKVFSSDKSILIQGFQVIRYRKLRDEWWYQNG